MIKRKLKKEEFRITIKGFPLSEEKKRKLLYECFDIILSDNSEKKVIKK